MLVEKTMITMVRSDLAVAGKYTIDHPWMVWIQSFCSPNSHTYIHNIHNIHLSLSLHTYPLYIYIHSQNAAIVVSNLSVFITWAGFCRCRKDLGASCLPSALKHKHPKEKGKSEVLWITMTSRIPKDMDLSQFYIQSRSKIHMYTYVYIYIYACYICIYIYNTHTGMEVS